MTTRLFCFKIIAGLGIILTGLGADSQNIFVRLSTASTLNPVPASINPPAGNLYSAAAPVTGTYWNIVDLNTVIPMNTTALTTYPYSGNNQAAGGTVVSSTDSTLSGVSLTVTYYSDVTTSSKTQPSTGTGENTLQPGGVMQNAWRNYYNASGNYFTFKLAGLSASTPYGLYFYGGTTGSGQGAGVALLPSNALGSNSTNATTTNTVANSNSSYGSIWTVSGGTTNLIPQSPGTGPAWSAIYGKSDASGNFTFNFNGPGNGAYMNGFQVVPLTAPVINNLTNQTVIQGNSTILAPTISALPAASYQWQTNGVNIAGATGATLSLNNVQYAQNNWTYSLIASNAVNVATQTMTLTVIVTPTVTGLFPQTASPGDNVSIAATVSGVPTPALQWQFNGVNLTNGLDANGSTIAGSAFSTLQINNAQTADSGTYSLIATNTAGIVTNSTTLTVSSGNVAPVISGLANQTVVQSSNATFTASVSGLPVPTLQWLDQTGTPIPNATNDTLTLNNVQFSQNGYAYSLVASNTANVVTDSATLYVLVPASISNEPISLVVTNTQSASFSVTAGGVPAPTYQWYFNNITNPIAGAVGATYSIAHAIPANIGNYFVIVSNSVSSVTSSIVTLTVNSLMQPSVLAPANGATGICYDTPLYITFSSTPTLRTNGTIKIYNVTNPTTPVDTIDLSQNITEQSPYAVNVQSRNIAGAPFFTFPVIISNNTAAIYPHLDLLKSNQTYYVTVDDGTFADSTGAYFAGIAANTWQFTTKPTGPANATNLVVASDGTGDFATVQGAIDSVPANNSTPTSINIQNGTYTEIVYINSKNDLDLRGQSRGGTFVGYPNNNNVNENGAPWRACFIVNGNNCSFENLTITNMTPLGGSQAEAVDVEGTEALFENIEMDSYQDTFLVHSAGKLVYFQDSLITGQTDFNWGYGTVYYTNCELRCTVSGGHVTQPRSPYTTNGFGFYNCRITQGYSGSANFDLGRTISTPTSPSEVLFADCLMASVVTGYSSDAGTNMSDYACSNLTGTASITLANSVHLTASDPYVIAIQNASTWLYGWQPRLLPNIITNPIAQSASAGQGVTFTSAAYGVPNVSYQWYQNGNRLTGATGATLSIPSAVRTNGGSYYVVANNSAGSVTSSIVNLTYVDTPPVAHPVSYIRYASVPLRIYATNLLGNVTDADNDPISLTGIGASTNGVTLSNQTTSLIYTNANNVNDQFTYTVSDGFGGTSTSYVNIVISMNSVFGPTGPSIVSGAGVPTLTFDGIAGYNYSIERSSDLVGWSVIFSTNMPAGGVFQFTDGGALPQDAYYRLEYNP